MSAPRASDECFDDAETMPADQIESQRWARISRVLRHAGEHLPFYQRAFAVAGYRPGPVHSADEFAARVPRMRKSDLIAAIRESGSAAIGIEAIGGRRVSNIVMTSGTQGFNTFAFLSRSDLLGGNLRNAVRELWMVKVRPGMRVLTLGPAWHVLALLDARALTAIGAQTVVPWGTFAPRFSANFVDAVRRLRPEHVLVTAPVLRGMLQECERLGLPPVEVFAPVRYVACAGESLSPSFRRSVIDAMALDDLFERGGSSDGMFGGGECGAHRGHHVFADLHYVEVVNPVTGAPLPPGTRGSAVVTNLTLGRSVYVRFDTEDVAAIVPGDCPCGRTHPVIELYGRLADSVVLGDRIITPADVRAGLDEFPHLVGEPFHLAALEDGGVRVKLDAGTRMSETLFVQLAGLLQDRLQAPVAVEAGESFAVGWKGQPMRER